jgi:hypothetical protein
MGLITETIDPKVEKREYANLLHERLIRACRSDPAQFIQYVISWGIPDWKPMGVMHRRWQETLTTGGNRILIMTPRNHAKTTMISIGRILWELGNNPDLRIKLICQNDDTAIKRLAAITDHIERNPRLHEIFPELVPADKGTWSKTRIYIRRQIISPDPSVEALGILSTAVGGRSDLLSFDDPVDFRNALQQPALRNVIKDAYDNVWMNIPEPGSRVWYTATPWHLDDLSHKLSKDPLYTKIEDKIGDDYVSIWPEKWTSDDLRAKEQEIGLRAYARAFKMKALSDDETLFSETAINGCIEKGLHYGNVPTTHHPVKYFMGVDLGGARSLTGSYTVIFTGAVVEGKKIPVNIIRGRFKSPEFAHMFFETLQEYKPELAFIENNSSQEAVVQWVKEVYGREVRLPVEGYFTGNQKMDDVVGLPSMAVEFEQKSWKLPEMHPDSCSCGYCMWIRELKEFPLGKFSDTVMASWLFREAVRKMTFKTPRILSLSSLGNKSNIFSFLEEDEDDYED